VSELPEQYRLAVEEAGWTEGEVWAFLAELDEFRAGLGDKQRDVFDRALALAGEAANDDDVSGFLVVPAIIGIIIAPLPPPTNPPKTTTGSVRPRPTPPPPPGPPPA